MSTLATKLQGVILALPGWARGTQGPKGYGSANTEAWQRNKTETWQSRFLIHYTVDVCTTQPFTIEERTKQN